MNTAAVAAACHALGEAVSAGVVADRPSGVLVRGASLPAALLRDLTAGLSGVTVVADHGDNGDNVAVLGYLLGLLTVRIVVPVAWFTHIGGLPGLAIVGDGGPSPAGVS